MTASAVGAASDIELIRHQTRVTRDVIRLNSKGITHEDSVVQPLPAGNCLNWVVGHLLFVYDQALPLLGQQPVMAEGALKAYARGAAPLTDPAQAIELGELLAAVDEAAARYEAGVAALTPEVLDRPAPASPRGEPETIRSLLATICFHQAYHTGQLGLLRRIAGREGAIP